MQVFDPLHAQLHELAVVHLETHLQRKAVSVSHEQFVRIPHGVVVEIRVAAMRRAHNARNARLFSGFEHRQAFAQIARSIVDARQNMAMDIAHRRFLSALVRTHFGRASSPPNNHPNTTTPAPNGAGAHHFGL